MKVEREIFKFCKNFIFSEATRRQRLTFSKWKRELLHIVFSKNATPLYFLTLRSVEVQEWSNEKVVPDIFIPWSPLKNSIVTTLLFGGALCSPLFHHAIQWNEAMNEATSRQLLILYDNVRYSPFRIHLIQ